MFFKNIVQNIASLSKKWGVFVLKSGLKILIRAPEVPFLVSPKTPNMGHFGCFGY